MLDIAPLRTLCDNNSQDLINTFNSHTPNLLLIDLLVYMLVSSQLALYTDRHADTHAGSVFCLAHSITSSLGVPKAWLTISARSPEAALISSRRSRLCAVCSSAKECQVGVLWPSRGLVLSYPNPQPPEAHRGRQACGWPPSGTDSHTGLIHLASGNRHLSLRIP